MSEITVACVLKTGGEYYPEHVALLKDGVAENLPQPHRFICLTDTPKALDDVETVELENSTWNRWWPIIEAYRIPPPVLFFGLDTIITGDLSGVVHAARNHGILVLEDVYRRGGHIQNSVMSWSIDMRWVYDSFMSDPGLYMRKYRGDQDYLEAALTGFEQPFFKFWQDALPGQLASFKVDIVEKGLEEPPQGTRVVFFHGHPRPWQQQLIPYG